MAGSLTVNNVTYDIIARDKASKTLDHVGRKFGGLSKQMGLLAGAAAGLAVIAGARMLKGFVEDAAEAAKVTRITANAIKVTGGAAKVTTKQVEALSEAISNKTAVDDEAVQAGANLLLTFKNVRNEAGQGNKVFDEATKAAVDLSAAGFGSIESSAKMLGKALNDPLKGLTALGRAGVTFTEQQKETIAKLVEQGDLLAAQKIIMGEIATQVGGAAEAAASPVDKLKTIFANLGEELGATLLPYLEDFANWLIDEGVPKIEDAIAVFRDEWIPVIQDIWGDIQDNLIPILEEMVGFVEDNKDMVWLLVGALVAWKGAQLAVNFALAANPLVAVITLVASAIGIFMEMNTVTGDWHKTLETLALYIASVPILGPLFTMLADLDGAMERVRNNVKNVFEDILRFTFNAMVDFAEFILRGAEAAFGWIPGMDDKFATAREALTDFRKKVNVELSKIADEDVVIRIKPGGLERVTKSVAASAAARFTGGGFEAGITVPPPTFGGTGGSLGVRTSGLSSEKIVSLASKIGDQAGDRAFSEMQALFKAGRFASMFTFGAGPGIPGKGRLFPLPAGTYHRTQGPHDGGAIDYGAPFGTPVRASFSGMLDISDLGNRSYGKFYRLFGPGQRSILGAHLSSFAHGDGPISRGQMIGRVGSTGNSTGPHLHLLGFDRGGWLPPGLSLAYNGTGQSERVTPGSSDPKSWAREFVRELRTQGLVLAPVDARRADLLARGG